MKRYVANGLADLTCALAVCQDLELLVVRRRKLDRRQFLDNYQDADNTLRSPLVDLLNCLIIQLCPEGFADEFSFKISSEVL